MAVVGFTGIKQVSLLMPPTTAISLALLQAPPLLSKAPELFESTKMPQADGHGKNSPVQTKVTL
jgi:hypothetical protein